MKFQAIKQNKVSDIIIEQIKNLISDGTLKPGELLPSERDLAETFGVSRPPVREAINALTALGLLEKHHGKGTMVKSVLQDNFNSALSSLVLNDTNKVLELIEVRKSIECWTAYFSAQRRTDEDIIALNAIVDKMKVSYMNDLPSKTDDADLHLCIAKSTQNTMWLHMMHTIIDVLHRFLDLVWDHMYLSFDDRRMLLDQHVEIVEAIKNKQPQQAYDAMLKHLTYAEQKSVRFLNSSEIQTFLNRQ